MPAASYTRATLRARWQQEVQDTAGTYAAASIFSDLLNDAMGDWCELARQRVVNDAIDIVANQSVYSLTGLTVRCIEILRASCPTGSAMTDDAALNLLTQAELDHIYPNWRSEVASWPHSVIRDLQGPQSLRLYPTPDSSQQATVRAGTLLANQTTGVLMNLVGLTSAQATAQSGVLMNPQFLVGSLQLYYIGHSTDISADSTTVETACGIAPDFQDALLWYCVARFFESDVPIAQVQKAPIYWAKWEAELAKATGLEKRQFQTRPPRATRKRFF